MTTLKQIARVFGLICLFVLIPVGCAIYTAVSLQAQDPAKANATTAKAIVTIESLQKELEEKNKIIAGKDQLINWHVQKETQLTVQVNGIQQYCTASLQLNQLDGIKPPPTADMLPPTPTTPNTQVLTPENKPAPAKK